nr:hypothetical protein [uncultured Rhodopila sp.]
MSIFKTVGEARMLRAEGDRQIARALANAISGFAARFGRRVTEIWQEAVSMTLTETSSQLQPARIRRGTR